jgi:hypothetical protein
MAEGLFESLHNIFRMLYVLREEFNVMSIRRDRGSLGHFSEIYYLVANRHPCLLK